MRYGSREVTDLRAEVAGLVVAGHAGEPFEAQQAFPDFPCASQ